MSGGRHFSTDDVMLRVCRVHSTPPCDAQPRVVCVACRYHIQSPDSGDVMAYEVRHRDVVKLGDFGTGVIGERPVCVDSFTTLENSPPELLTDGDAAVQVRLRFISACLNAHQRPRSRPCIGRLLYGGVQHSNMHRPHCPHRLGARPHLHAVLCCAVLSQSFGGDVWCLGLCMLHVATGCCPYEEILADVVCPPTLRDALHAVWSQTRRKVRHPRLCCL